MLKSLGTGMPRHTRKVKGALSQKVAIIVACFEEVSFVG
jgi:hypothetical protein